MKQLTKEEILEFKFTLRDYDKQKTDDFNFKFKLGDSLVHQIGRLDDFFIGLSMFYHADGRPDNLYSWKNCRSNGIRKVFKYLK